MVLVLTLVACLSAKSCSLKHYKYCEIALGKKSELAAKTFKKDTQNEIPNFKRKYKTKGIQVIIPGIPCLTIHEFTYCNDFVIGIIKSSTTQFQIRANCKRGPPTC